MESEELAKEKQRLQRRLGVLSGDVPVYRSNAPKSAYFGGSHSLDETQLTEVVMATSHFASAPPSPLSEPDKRTTAISSAGTIVVEKTTDSDGEEDDREVISVLDMFLAQKRKENQERLQIEEQLWEREEDDEADNHQEDKEDKDKREKGKDKQKENGESDKEKESEHNSSKEVLALPITPKVSTERLRVPTMGLDIPSPTPQATPKPELIMKWKVRIFAVVNRLSGKGRKANVEEVFRREGGFRWKWDIFYIKTGKEDMAAEVRQKVVKERKYDWVFACGGDGTVSSLVSLLVGTDIPLGVIPLGTGNAFAQEMRIPLKWKHAVRMISHHHVRRTLTMRAIDVMNMGDRYYMLTIDIGIGAKTVEDAANHAGMKRRLGVGAYLISATKAMVNQQPQLFSVMIDGRPQVGIVASEVVLCNAGMLGMGHDIRWGPNISVDDGCIDLVFIEASNLADYVSVIKALGTGGDGNKRIKYLRATNSIEISSNEEAPVAADGDLIGSLPISIKVIKGAFNVLLPKKEDRTKSTKEKRRGESNSEQLS